MGIRESTSPTGKHILWGHVLMHCHLKTIERFRCARDAFARMPIFAAATMRAIATITVAICSHSWLFSLDERGPQSLGLEKN